MDEVKRLKVLNMEKDKNISELERRVDNLEQYSRMNDIVITGLKIKPRSYARAAAGDKFQFLRPWSRAPWNTKYLLFSGPGGLPWI